jgi:hydrogenase maturation factor
MILVVAKENVDQVLEALKEKEEEAKIIGKVFSDVEMSEFVRLKNLEVIFA